MYLKLRRRIPHGVRWRSTRYMPFVCLLQAIESAQGGENAPVGLLNQGPDTAQAYQSLLAGYAGLPLCDKEHTLELLGLKRLSVALARRGL